MSDQAERELQQSHLHLARLTLDQPHGLEGHSSQTRLDHGGRQKEEVTAARHRSRNGELNCTEMNVGMLCTMLRFGHFEDDPCLDLLRPARHEIATNRTETIEEALENSLLSFLPLNSTDLTEEVLEEAFCRDVESYSEVFQVDVDDLHHRPSHCPVIADSQCAVLYDSGSCSGGWRLPVSPGAQQRLLYWSADYKYRNDADLVGVRNGCTFTGFTGDNFDGDSFVLTGGAHDRWVLFEESPRFSRFHESILSFQCNCR